MLYNSAVDLTSLPVSGTGQALASLRLQREELNWGDDAVLQLPSLREPAPCRDPGETGTESLPRN